MGQKVIMSLIRKYFEINENVTQHTKTYGMQEKTMLKEKILAINAYIKREREHKSITNFIPYSPRKRRVH